MDLFISFYSFLHSTPPTIHGAMCAFHFSIYCFSVVCLIFVNTFVCSACLPSTRSTQFYCRRRMVLLLLQLLLNHRLQCLQKYVICKSVRNGVANSECTETWNVINSTYTFSIDRNYFMSSDHHHHHRDRQWEKACACRARTFFRLV